MGQQWRRRAVAGVVGAIGLTGLVVSLSGCGLLIRASYEEDATLTGEITEVRIDSNNGGVTLRGDESAGEVALHARVKYRGSRPDEATYRVEEGVLVLAGCGRNCSVDYTVDLPAGLPVTGETRNGRISLTNAGRVDVRTSNGAVTLHDAAGSVAVRSSNGRIEVTLSTPQDVQASTSNGAISVTVPQGGYQLSTSTSNGRVESDVVDDPGGAHRLELETSNGSITVRAT